MLLANQKLAFYKKHTVTYKDTDGHVTETAGSVRLRESGNELPQSLPRACFAKEFMDDIICLKISQLDKFFNLSQNPPSTQNSHICMLLQHNACCFKILT